MSLTKVTYAMIQGCPINPQDYGVVGDGVTDDAAAMQLAINAAIANQVPLSLAPVTYNITANVLTATLAANKSLIIMGNGAIFNTTIADASNYYDGFLTVTGTSANKVVISNLTIISNQAGVLSIVRARGKMIGLAVKTIEDLQLTDVNISGFGFINIWLYYIDKGQVLNCSGNNSKYAGLFIQSSTNLTIYGGVYNENGGDNSSTPEGYGVSCATLYQVGDRDNAKVRIDGITANNNIGKGIDAHDCLGFTVVNNSIKGFLYSGIYALNEGASKNVSDIVIIGNTIEGTSAYTSATSSYGIQVGGTTSTYIGAIIVSNNNIKTISSSTANNFGIFVNNQNLGYVAPTSVLIANNTLYNTGLDGTLSSSCIRTNNATGTLPLVSIIGNTIYQTVASYYAILTGLISYLTVSENTIVTTSTFSSGIYPDIGTTMIANGNIFKGTFSSDALTIFSVAKQIARGNIVNDVPLKDYMNSGISIDFGSATPVAGYYYAGSIRYNSAVVVGQPKGWQCTVSGTPGTWVSMGNL